MLQVGVTLLSFKAKHSHRFPTGEKQVSLENQFSKRGVIVACSPSAWEHEADVELTARRMRLKGLLICLSIVRTMLWWVYMRCSEDLSDSLRVGCLLPSRTELRPFGLVASTLTC